MTALTRKERDRRLRQEDILKAAEHIFAIKGYHEASIQDIAKEAQYAVGTVYLYFKDKEALYITLIERKFQESFLALKNRITQVSSVKEKIKVLVEEQLDYFEKNEDFFRIFFSERGNFNFMAKDRISYKVRERFLHYVDYVASLIKAAQDKRIIRSDFPAKRLAYILASMLNAVIFPWLRRDSAGSLPCVTSCGNGKGLRGMSGFILDVFFNGVRAK